MISLLCPTRSRVDGAKKLLLSLKENQTFDNQLIFYIQEDDHDLNKYKEMFLEMNHKDFIIGPWIPTVDIWNFLAREIAKYDLLTLMADDVVIKTKGWDLVYLEKSTAFKDGIFLITCWDGRNENIPNNLNCPHYTISRKTMNILGYFFPPFYSHRFGDHQMDELFSSIKRKISINDVLFDHQKQLYASDKTNHKGKYLKALYVENDKQKEFFLFNDEYFYKKIRRYFEADLSTLLNQINK
jgi:hypothetical protein